MGNEQYDYTAHEKEPGGWIVTRSWVHSGRIYTQEATVNGARTKEEAVEKAIKQGSWA